MGLTLDMVLAKIALEIMNCGQISQETREMASGCLMQFDDEVELFNAIFIPHRRRWESCVDSESKCKEASLLCGDYRSLCEKCYSLHIQESLLLALFRFATLEDAFSLNFREICVSLQREVEECTSSDVQVAICTRVVSMIVRCHLYGQQPFDSILEDFVSKIEEVNLNNPNIRQISLLE